MEVSNILAAIDAEIVKLQQARSLLAGVGTAVVKSGRGRPKGSKNVTATVVIPARAAKAAKAPAKTKGKRQLSPEGRKAIAEAMKRRWAERRKQAAKSVAK